MDEIEYKLNTSNSVLVVNAVEKLISLIKSKFKPADRKKFVLENEELKFLREKCSAKDTVVSLTACQGLLALVELGVLEIGHTMSTIVTLLPTAHNYSAIISSMAGLLILDLKSRLVPGQAYVCQFSLKSPQHPFITVLEKNKAAVDDVLTQMHALCTHPDYIVSSNSLELLRPVFAWLACRHVGGARPWQLLLALPQSRHQTKLLLSCLSCQQICNPQLIERAFEAYAAVADTAIHRRDREYVEALLPMLARISNELIKHGRDPRACYSLMERCLALEAPMRRVAGLTLALLADNLPPTSALYLHELFNLGLNIATKYKVSNLSLSIFVALSLQWLHMPSYLTTSALKVGSKILDLYQASDFEDRLDMPNLKTNKIFETLYYTDNRLSVTFKLHEIWERIRDDPEKLKFWLGSIKEVDGIIKLELVVFLIGIAMEKRQEEWYEEVVVSALTIVVEAVDIKKELSVMLLPILVYKIANDKSPAVKKECLRALPLMAKTKENVPNIVAILNKLKAGKGVPTSFLIEVYTSLAETQVRCFPYLQELLADTAAGRPDDLKWEVDVAKAAAVSRICEIRPSTHGLELVPTISSILNRCVSRACSVPAALVLRALGRLWRAAALAPPSTWRALETKLARDNRLIVQISICELLALVPSLRVDTAEYSQLISDAARALWTRVANADARGSAAACDALRTYKLDDYTLKDVPEIYRSTVKLPASYCKTPVDAARRPEDVLDYIPCEIWPEVFKYTNQEALGGVERLATKLIEREVRAYRSGVYQPEARVEPQGMGYLPATSVLRGIMDCFKKQVTSPSYDYTDAVLLSMLRTLNAEYPKPLPPVDLCFLHEALHKGAQWRSGGLTLAARQAQSVGSARRLIENWLQTIDPETSEESEILLLFSLLPPLCRGLPPNSLRPPLERCLASAAPRPSTPAPLFVSQLDYIREALECDKIHDANRTLLSQILENYFAVVPEDHEAWPAYVQASRHLPSKYLERMTSPSSWWEVTSEALRKAASLRVAVAIVAAVDGTGAPLNWLNEVIDAQAGHIADQQYSLQCILAPLKAVKPDEPSTREWFLQLMARTQVAFKETEDLSAHLYLCDVFILSAAVLSGHWRVCGGHWRGTEPAPDRSTLRAMLPDAAAALMTREAWKDNAIQMLEWLSHTRDCVRDAATAEACQRALLALRHAPQFTQHRIWTRLESYFGKQTNTDD